MSPPPPGQAPPGGAADWDAETYHRVSDPQVAWAEAVLDRLDPAAGETVLDAGCGSGRVTELLADRLAAADAADPAAAAARRGTPVIAVDAAPSMVARARELLGDRAHVSRRDLLDLSLADPVDAVFSNAVLHWVPDHDRLFERLFAALRPGGRLVVQCGGSGNVERFHEHARAVASEPPYAAHLAGWEGPWTFATAEATRARLERAGFEAVRTWLEPAPVVPPEPLDFLRSVCLRLHLEALPDELRAAYVAAVAARCGDPVELDYVRLNIHARRP